jgi:glycosyltransferase involved in cell wall biosynthesis
MTRKPPQLTFVIPCYNEADMLPETLPLLLALTRTLHAEGLVADNSGVLVIDDGSHDDSWAIITRFSSLDSRVSGIKLAGNAGHQKALLCGLLSAPGDALISIDADLQDDLAAVRIMLNNFREGSDIVYGVRESRQADSRFKRISAETFYRALAALGVKTVFNHADFRLMSRAAIEALRQFPERSIYLRGIMPLIGLPSSSVFYSRRVRQHGQTKYSLRKMAALATDAVTTMSVVPLRAVAALGLLIFAGTSISGIWVLGTRLLTDKAVPGWASTALPIYFLGGIQLLCLGVIGEYLGKIYIEVKRRPPFLIEATTPADFSPGYRKTTDFRADVST